MPFLALQIILVIFEWLCIFHWELLKYISAVQPYLLVLNNTIYDYWQLYKISFIRPNLEHTPNCVCTPLTEGAKTTKSNSLHEVINNTRAIASSLHLIQIRTKIVHNTQVLLKRWNNPTLMNTIADKFRTPSD